MLTIVMRKFGVVDFDQLFEHAVWRSQRTFTDDEKLALRRKLYSFMPATVIDVPGAVESWTRRQVQDAVREALRLAPDGTREYALWNVFYGVCSWRCAEPDAFDVVTKG